MSNPVHSHEIQIYYEDTDFTGVVYHANYLKYFERAREHMLGVDELVRLHTQDGIAFVVYRAELTYREGARHGDTLEIRSRAREVSNFRVAFDQEVYRKGGSTALVVGTVELVCINMQHKLVALPATVRDLLKNAPFGEAQ